MTSWKTITSKIVYENPWMVVHEDKVTTPSGKPGVYGYVDSKCDSVYVVPVDNEGNTYIIQQERYTVKQTTWECVAGRMDSDSVEVAAKRELLEETGLLAETITVLRSVQVANGMTTFKSYICLAKGIRRMSDVLDPDDGIQDVMKLPLASLPSKILDGEIECSQSIAAFFIAIAYLDKEMAI